MALLLAHLVVTCFLAGLIWTVQLVHYPLFADVGAEAWTAYHGRHTRAITAVVAPAMLLEVGTWLGLLVMGPPWLPAWAGWTGSVLLGVVWLSTALLQVPQHGRLGHGFDARSHRQLVGTNWVRTAAWTGRVALLLLVVEPLLGQPR